MANLLFIGIGGMIGTLLRYAVSGLTYRYFDGVFPWGTLSVNLIGSFAIGFLWGLFERAVILPDVRVFVFIGILGGFTTFSSYTLESFNLLRDGEVKLALMNMLLNNILGIGLVFSGFAASKYLIAFLKTEVIK